MANEYIELWTRKHGKRYRDYVLSRMDITQFDELERLARNIVFDGKTIKKVNLKQEYLSLSVFAFFTGIIISFFSLFMPVFFKNASVAASSIGAMTIFTSSVINRKTLHDIKELEMHTYSKYNKLVSSIEDHEVDDVKNELIQLMRNYTHTAPYACSTYIMHWHLKKLSELTKQICGRSMETPDDNESIGTLASKVVFDYKCSQGAKVHKKSINLSLKKFIAGSYLVLCSLLCQKWYEDSTIPDIRNSHVPSIVSCIGVFIILHSILWFVVDEISVRVLKKNQLGNLGYELFSPTLVSEEVNRIGSEIKDLPNTQINSNEDSLSRTDRIFHIV